MAKSASSKESKLDINSEGSKIQSPSKNERHLLLTDSGIYACGELVSSDHISTEKAVLATCGNCKKSDLYQKALASLARDKSSKEVEEAKKSSLSMFRRMRTF